MVHPHVLQGLLKTTLMLQESHSLPLLEHLKHTSWSMARIESGAGPNFLEQDHSKFKPFITTGWLSTLWEFLSMYNVRLSQSFLVPLRRSSNDKYIMPVVIKGKYSTSQLQLFNVCRIFLQVELVSDILNMQGTRVKEHIWKGQRIVHSRYECAWPVQPRPTKAAWNVWHSILQSEFHLDSTGKTLSLHSIWSE
jgi:hypothetical protein